MDLESIRHIRITGGLEKAFLFIFLPILLFLSSAYVLFKSADRGHGEIVDASNMMIVQVGTSIDIERMMEEMSLFFIHKPLRDKAIHWLG